MTELFKFANQFIEGKDISPHVKRVLDLLFTIGISAHFYTLMIGEYMWIELTSYGKVLDFFVKGHFFLPMAFFLGVHYFLNFLGFGVFSLFVRIKAVRIKKRIQDYQYDRYVVNHFIDGVVVFSALFLPEKISENDIEQTHDEINKALNPQKLQVVMKDLNKAKREVRFNFIFFLKAMIAMSIFMCSIESFSIWIYALLAFVLLCLMAVQFYAYWILEVIPSVVKKVWELANRHFSSDAPKLSINQHYDDKTEN